MLAVLSHDEAEDLRWGLPPEHGWLMQLIRLRDRSTSNPALHWLHEWLRIDERFLEEDRMVVGWDHGNNPLETIDIVCGRLVPVGIYSRKLMSSVYGGSPNSWVYSNVWEL